MVGHELVLSWCLSRRDPVADRAGRGASGSVQRLASDSGVVAEVLDAIRALPAELGLAAAEVPIGRRLLVDGPAEVEVFDDAGGSEIEMPADHLLELGRGHPPGAEGIHH